MNQILIAFHFDPETVERAVAPEKRTKAGPKRQAESRSERIRKLNLIWGDELWMPVRLRLAGADLFLCGGHTHRRNPELQGPGPDPIPEGHKPCPWETVNVLELARRGPIALIKADRVGEGGVMVPYQGELTFRKVGDTIEVEFLVGVGPTRRSAAVLFEDLLQNWLAFSEEVRTQFLGEVPELAEHKEFGRWFRDGLDYLRQ
jgi:hypothetical protein